MSTGEPLVAQIEAALAVELQTLHSEWWRGDRMERLADYLARHIAEKIVRAEVAILAAADALRDNDPAEAYHQLYGYADPSFTDTGDPFEKLRCRAALQAARPLEENPT